jgi:hypothetical protein
MPKQTAQKEIWKWMLDHIVQVSSALELATMATEQFSEVIGIDTFVWNDAQIIWDYCQTNSKGKKYANV